MMVRHAAVMAGLALGLMSGTSRAAYVINIDQSGANVVATGSGMLDVNDLTFEGFQEPSVPGVSGTYVEVGNGPFADYYAPISGPSSFGAGSLVDANSASGAIVGLDAGLQEIIVPSGVPTSGFDYGTSTATFDNTTISALGLKSGTYTYTFGSGSDADSFTINVGTVPLPDSAPLFGAALLALGVIGYGMKRKGATA